MVIEVLFIHKFLHTVWHFLVYSSVHVRSRFCLWVSTNVKNLENRKYVRKNTYIQVTLYVNQIYALNAHPVVVKNVTLPLWISLKIVFKSKQIHIRISFYIPQTTKYLVNSYSDILYIHITLYTDCINLDLD